MSVRVGQAIGWALCYAVWALFFWWIGAPTWGVVGFALVISGRPFYNKDAP